MITYLLIGIGYRLGISHGYYESKLLRPSLFEVTADVISGLVIVAVWPWFFGVRYYNLLKRF